MSNTATKSFLESLFDVWGRHHRASWIDGDSQKADNKPSKPSESKSYFQIQPNIFRVSQNTQSFALLQYNRSKETMDLLKSLSFDSSSSNDLSSTKAKTAMTTSTSLDWVDDTVNCISRMCNLCGQYEIQQVGYEWLLEQQRQGQVLSRKDLEVELYRKFLFDESSVKLNDE